MNITLNARQSVMQEIADIPDEFIPFILEQIKAYKENFKKKTNYKQSPAKRLLKLSGSLENPGSLNAKQYKQQVIDEYLSHRL